MESILEKFTTTDLILFGVVILLGVFCSAMSVKNCKPSPKEVETMDSDTVSTDMPTVETIQEESPKDDSLTTPNEDKPL